MQNIQIDYAVSSTFDQNIGLRPYQCYYKGLTQASRQGLVN